MINSYQLKTVLSVVVRGMFEVVLPVCVIVGGWSVKSSHKVPATVANPLPKPSGDPSYGIWNILQER